jgi:glutamate-1-semialdehyde 2,1-aminomutase/spore coat polysaccharide biosynthesis protein SpsF
MHPLEVEVAELLVEVIPCAEMVRFAKNGSDVTSAAIRVARAYTGREKVAKCGYHGAQDWYIASTSRDRGVPRFNKELIFEFKYNQIETLERIFAEHPGEIAAVIMEPITSEEPKDEFLQEVKDLAHRNGAVLIFDEVKSGFRVALGGAQEYYGVVPDLACFGKAMANGMPISALVGRREVMKELENVFFSMTFGGEALSLAASLSTIHELREKNVLAHVWKQGEKLKNGYNALVEEFDLMGCTRCVGLPPKSVIQFYDAEGMDALTLKSLFQQEVIKRGILFNGEHMLSFSHSDEDIERTIEAYREALAVVKLALETGAAEKMLEGRKLEAVFRER